MLMVSVDIFLTVTSLMLVDSPCLSPLLNYKLINGFTVALLALGSDFGNVLLEHGYFAVHLFYLELQTVCLSNLSVEDSVNVVLTTLQ
jgi:hypothetical protein